MKRFLEMRSINKLAIAEVRSYANCVPLRLKINLNIWDRPLALLGLMQNIIGSAHRYREEK
ncbi:hypothetical protein FIS3754_33460 [Fischerella sp. NIES-3754]|nr:hypothetical protein FIS3754_33460 [Fischerella sp. NIES-3754]BCX09746.1 MAG: hypothetical protein KatS3mg066_3605 [Fischerella sp.]